MTPGTPVLALAAAATIFGMSVAIAQTSPAPPAPPAQPPFAIPPYKNLKVLEKHITRPELLGTMKFFAQSLGVRCTYCHVGAEGQPLSGFDFASDAKEHKNTARGMMQFVAHLNKDHLPVITGLPDAKVTCFTCHRGATKPATEVPPGVILVPPPPSATPVAPKAERGAG
jgi:hypothetical protein